MCARALHSFHARLMWLRYLVIDGGTYNKAQMKEVIEQQLQKKETGKIGTATELGLDPSADFMSVLEQVRAEQVRISDCSHSNLHNNLKSGPHSRSTSPPSRLATAKTAPSATTRSGLVGFRRPPRLPPLPRR